MKSKILHEKKIGGMISVIFGLVSLYEAKRMYEYSKDLVTGDHAFPGLIGILLILAGFSLLFEKNKDIRKVEFPARNIFIVLVSSIILLFLYSMLITYTGYVVSTLVIAISLIKIIGKYRWIFSIISGGIITLILYFIFIVLLKTPLPTGIFGI
jgi:putative tricarboxylic transport membrane protein